MSTPPAARVSGVALTLAMQRLRAERLLKHSDSVRPRNRLPAETLLGLSKCANFCEDAVMRSLIESLDCKLDLGIVLR